MNRARPWLLAGAVALLVLLADQLSKLAVEESITPGETRSFFPGVQLVYTHNRGVAFGLFPNAPALVIALIAAALVVLLVYFQRHITMPLIWLPTGLLIGGALGNIVDRVRQGSVTDFIKLPLGWPPFNLADSAITIGVIALFLVIEHARTHS
ncbi:MAG TPA: signal peptidase II [Solirubrobacteraceae bacterium]|nr:signal peptidase II [Solirubrobacteraceae bacterium]